MGWGHRPRAATGRDTPRPAAGRQAGPVGVIGLERRQGGKHSCQMENKSKRRVETHQRKVKTKRS